jgi:hypothetical protein
MATMQLRERGIEAKTESHWLEKLDAWIDPTSVGSIDSPDAVILQHDNSEAASKMGSGQFRFYGSHQAHKHGPLSPRDFVARRHLCMVDNVTLALSEWFQAPFQCVFTTSRNVVRHNRRVAIHPSSSASHKNWPESHFHAVADALRQEQCDVIWLTHGGQNLNELADILASCSLFIGNDSGPGHLASALGTPTLIVGPEYSHMQLWRPGWSPGHVICPPRWATFFRWGRKNWQQFITKSMVISFLKRNYI